MDWTTSTILKHCESLWKETGECLCMTLPVKRRKSRRYEVTEAASYHIFCFLPCLLFAHRPPLLPEECRDSLCYFGISRTISPWHHILRNFCCKQNYSCRPYTQFLFLSRVRRHMLKTLAYSSLLSMCNICATYISSNGDSLQPTPNVQSDSDKLCQWNSKSILISLSYTNTTGLNFHCFLQVAISAIKTVQI